MSSDTAARYTVAGRAWDREYRQICLDRGIGHAIVVKPESEVYRFGNGGLLTSTERVTVPVVLTNHPLLLSHSVVESPVLSLLIGRDVVEGLGLDIKGSSKTLEYNGQSQPLEDSVAGHYCVTLSTERYAGLMKLKNSPDPPISRLRPRPTSLIPKCKKSKLASTLEVCLSVFAVVKFVDSSTVAALPQQMCSMLIRGCSLARPFDASWTFSDHQQLQDQQWRRMRKGTVHPRRCGTCSNCGPTLCSSIPSCVLVCA